MAKKRFDVICLASSYLHTDLTYRLNESIAMLTTLVDTQPKEASSAGGKSREDEVKEKIEKELLP